MKIHIIILTNKRRNFMMKCKKCGKDIPDGFLLGCTGCGAYVCSDCGVSTMQICPYCYSNLEFFG